MAVEGMETDQINIKRKMSGVGESNMQKKPRKPVDHTGKNSLQVLNEEFVNSLPLVWNVVCVSNGVYLYFART